MKNLQNFIRVLFLVAFVVLTQLSCSVFVGTVKRVADNAKQDSYTSQSSKNPKPIKIKQIEDGYSFSDFQREILKDFENEDFEAIDRKTIKARHEKERFTGGYWKISTIYQVLTQIYGAPFETEELWRNHLEKVERWKKKSPDSTTARIVLAKSYIGYGWFARGTGFSRTVENEDMQKLHERLNLAYDELLEAQKLKDKCPEWYNAMLFLAMAQDWDADDYDKLLADAISFEPNYYLYYYAKAENSSTRWGGNKGDIENFAAEVGEIDSDEKNILYYLYVSDMFNSPHFKEIENKQVVSWKRAKAGYKELEQKYGVDNHRLNEYSFLASFNEDMPEAYQAFKKIGDNRDTEVYSKERFEEIRSWAIARYEAENPK